MFSLDKPSGQTSFYFHDALDSVVGTTKSNGQSDKNYRYGDFGGIEPQNGNFTSPHNNFTYTNQEYDDNLNLYEFYSRAYDPTTGTWLQQDGYRGEIQSPQTLHRYGYVKNSPITYRDWYGYSTDVNINKEPSFGIEKPLLDGAMAEQGGCIGYEYLKGCSKTTALGANAKAAANLESVGVSGEALISDSTGDLILGNGFLGINIGCGVKLGSTELMAGYADKSVGLNAGATYVQGDLHAGLNLFNFTNIQLGVEAKLGLEVGVKIGKKTEVNIGLFSIKLTFDNPKTNSYYDKKAKDEDPIDPIQVVKDSSENFQNSLPKTQEQGWNFLQNMMCAFGSCGPNTNPFLPY